MAYQTFSIPRLLGLNQDENPDSLQPGELTVADNVIRRGNFVGTRPGLTALGSSTDYENDLTDTPSIEGSYEYRQNFDQARRLFVVGDKDSSANDIYYEDDANLDLTTNSIALQVGNGYAYSFTTHQNSMWVTGGPTGKSQVTNVDMCVWDGAAVSGAGSDLDKITLTDKGTTDTLRPKFVRSYKNYLLIGGLQGSGGNYPTASNNAACVRYATFATDPTVDANWADSNTIGFNASRVGSGSWGRTYCTGFAEYQDNKGSFLLILGNRNIASVRLDTQFGNDFIVTDDISNGCVHERAFVSLGLDSQDAIFMSEYGIHSLRQSQQFGGRDETFLSWKIRPFFNSINNSRIHDSVGVYAPKFGVVLFAVSTGTNSTHDSIIALDVKDAETLNSRHAMWYGPWKLGSSLKVAHMGYYRDESDVPQLYIFTTNGKVLVMDEDAHADISGGFSTVIRTADATLGRPDLEKRVGDTTITLATDIGGYNIQHRTYFDFGRRTSAAINPNVPSLTASTVDDGGGTVIGTATVGSSFATVTRKLYTRGRGYSISHEFSASGASKSFFIGRIDTQVAGAGEDAGQTGGAV